MGFGTLFVGYFLLLNVGYTYYTDALAAAIMLYAFYRLSSINKPFRRAAFAAGAFLVFGLSELILSLISSLGIFSVANLLFTIFAMLRHLIIFAITALMLSGIKEVALEVDLPYLAKRCVRNVYLALPIYTLCLILEADELASFIAPEILITMYFISLILVITITTMNLVQIYSAHMRIYIPDEEKEEKQSRFEFVNKFRRHEEEKSKEYAEYKLNKIIEKKTKKGK